MVSLRGMIRRHIFALGVKVKTLTVKTVYSVYIQLLRGALAFVTPYYNDIKTISPIIITIQYNHRYYITIHFILSYHLQYHILSQVVILYNIQHYIAYSHIIKP